MRDFKNLTEAQQIAILIAENLEKEGEAIKEYLPLIFLCEKLGKNKAARMFREIISDEKNHLLLLMGALQEFDGDIPVAADGIQKTFDELKQNLMES